MSKPFMQRVEFMNKVSVVVKSTDIRKFNGILKIKHQGKVYIYASWYINNYEDL